jgi:hypothetical protein
MLNNELPASTTVNTTNTALINPILRPIVILLAPCTTHQQAASYFVKRISTLPRFAGGGHALQIVGSGTSVSGNIVGSRPTACRREIRLKNPAFRATSTLDPTKMNVSQIALGGFQQAVTQMESAAARIARLPLAASAPPEDSVDLAASMVELIQAQRSAEANLAVIRTGDEVTRHTLDVLG